MLGHLQQRTLRHLSRCPILRGELYQGSSFLLFLFFFLFFFFSFSLFLIVEEGRKDIERSYHLTTAIMQMGLLFRRMTCIEYTHVWCCTICYCLILSYCQPPLNGLPPHTHTHLLTLCTVHTVRFVHCRPSEKHFNNSHEQLYKKLAEFPLVTLEKFTWQGDAPVRNYKYLENCKHCQWQASRNSIERTTNTVGIHVILLRESMRHLLSHSTFQRMLMCGIPMTPYIEG